MIVKPPEFQLVEYSLLRIIKRLVVVDELTCRVLIKIQTADPRGDGGGVILCIMHLR